MNLSSLADAKQRQLALNPRQSFIIQAPAGSGKTELLIQRYLSLLSHVQAPEAIIAITFTRKAAHEMRLRIMQSLEMVQQKYPLAANDRQRYQLAKKVLVRDQQYHWNLLANPNRLRILTIDSFCQSLTWQMPLLSGVPDLSPVDNPKWLYRIAVRELLNQLEDECPWRKSLVHLLTHLDNNFQHVENLLSDMLGRREQWLNYLLNHQADLRHYLEMGLQTISLNAVATLNQRIASDLRRQLQRVVNFSQDQLGKKPLVGTDDLRFWQAATHLLITKDNTWRKQFRKTEGFPAVNARNNKTAKSYRELKELGLALIAQLSQQKEIRDALIALKNAPPLHYSDRQWQTLSCLFELLPVLVAHLKVVFQQQQQCDYNEILLGALTALGQAENPSDLALRLDYQIEHLLVDEFQDTSSAQHQLIEKLTAGWQADEGRSLFLVGDPMQSIYRFRKAEVSLFLQVQHYGIGSIRLCPLTLSVNFRSNQTIVNWINTSFTKLLPIREDIQRGAIVYSPAIACSPLTSANAINYYWQQSNDSLDIQQSEAQQIINIIQQIKRQDPHSSIAILVRARNHLTALLPALQSAAIAYQAIEIDSLAEKPVIQDLVALTRALTHLADRISWLALLRAPYCGLSLTDLYQITQFKQENQSLSIWQQLLQFESIDLQQNTKQRLRRIVPILYNILNQQGRLPLAKWIKTAWINLGGLYCLSNNEETHDVDAFFQFVDNKIAQQEPIDFYNLENELAKHYTHTPQKSADTVEIMTIHKAKGLEYDHVILPSLHRKSSADPPQLLLYQEKFHNPYQQDLLLAPIKASAMDDDLIYNYLFQTEIEKSDHELSRLLYVACTRAKKSLHFLANIKHDEKNQLKKPLARSLLSHLWPALNINSADIATNTSATELTSPSKRLLKRLPADWQNPMADNLATDIKDIAAGPASFTYQWTLNPARAIGTVIHRLLYQISQEGLAIWDSKPLTSASCIFSQLLTQHGILEYQQADALLTLKTCLTKTLTDQKGRWILSQKHQAAQSEYAITAILNGKPQSLVIDRTFIDAATGKRWIIDYKTTIYTGNNPRTFLNDQRQQHKEQLETYARALQLDPLYQNLPICLGLYFPMHSLWCEWEFSTALNEIS